MSQVWGSDYGLATQLCAAVGLLYISSKLLSLIRLIFSLFLLPGKSPRSFGPKGSWALITGASDGIGLEFATQLAREKYNVILVSRTASKLSSLASTIEAEHGVSTKTLAIDFSKATDVQYTELSNQLKDLDIAVLINNVGRSHDIPVPFVQTPESEVADIIEINCVATLRVTSIVLPGMISRRRGLVLTMGSFGGLLPTPLLATYSGSKAFLQQWSSALGAEVASHGITVELVQSYLVTSALSKIKYPSLTIPTPKAFVKSVLGKIGRSGGAQGFAHTSTPYWSHAVMQWFIGTFAGFMGPFVLARNKSMHESIRKRALRKKEREAGKKAS